ncbi:MAG: octanoyltransferase, partial [Deltaproteobacteria bacterium]|nr:octanoyltransferase [Deltaproteobacteria bacterium]
MLIDIKNLGLQDYQTTFQIQNQLREERSKGTIKDTLLLLEHTKVVTVGVRSQEEDFLIPPKDLEKKGFQIHQV